MGLLLLVVTTLVFNILTNDISMCPQRTSSTAGEANNNEALLQQHQEEKTSDGDANAVDAEKQQRTGPEVTKLVGKPLRVRPAPDYPKPHFYNLTLQNRLNAS